MTYWNNFNSHARVGRDTRFRIFLHQNVISTHTPAWGVTMAVIRMERTNDDFNSHARVGRDLKPCKPKIARYSFQLIRPRGA